VTCRVAHGQQHRPVFPTGTVKGLITPWVPVHRIMGMLQQVRAGFEKKTVGVNGPTLIVEVPGSREVGIATPFGHFSDFIFHSHIPASFAGHDHRRMGLRQFGGPSLVNGSVQTCNAEENEGIPADTSQDRFANLCLLSVETHGLLSLTCLSKPLLYSFCPETRNFGRDQGMRKILPQVYG
jgi:hypothetical protein